MNPTTLKRSFDECSDDVFEYCYATLHDRGKALEVTQEVFCVAGGVLPEEIHREEEWKLKLIAECLMETA